MDPNGSYWILLDPDLDPDMDPDTDPDTDPNRFLQVPSGSFRFLQILPEFLAAFRLKDFQSCFKLTLSHTSYL